MTCSCYFQSLDYSHIPTFSKMEPHLRCKRLVIMGQNPGDIQRDIQGDIRGTRRRKWGLEWKAGGGGGGGGQYLWYAEKRERQTSDAPRKGGGGSKRQVFF